MNKKEINYDLERFSNEKTSMLFHSEIILPNFNPKLFSFFSNLVRYFLLKIRLLSTFFANSKCDVLEISMKY